MQETKAPTKLTKKSKMNNTTKEGEPGKLHY